MYTVARFAGFASQNDLLAIGAAMNHLQSGVFQRWQVKDDGFACDVRGHGTWAEHELAIGEFVARFRELIAQVVDRGVAVSIGVAVYDHDFPPEAVWIRLPVSPALLQALGSAGVTLELAIRHVGDAEARASSPEPDDEVPDLLPSQLDLAAVAALAPSELDEIDQALLAAAGPRNLKVAMIVVTVLRQFAARFPALPDVFYARRVLRLVNLGQLEGYGDLGRMRWSEVRLPRT
jgi:hypothetical protein